MILSVDVGYGRTKIATNTRKECFSSYLVRFRKNGPDFMNKADVVEVDSQKFFVGDKALSQGSPISIIGDSFHGSHYWKALLAYAIYTVRDEINENIDTLVLGLPLSQYNEERKMQLKSVRNFKFYVNGEEYDISVDNVVVLPQGAGAILEYIKKEEGTAIVDIGYYTLDLAYFREGGFNTAQSFSSNFGIQRLYQQISKEINKKFNISPDIKKIETIVRTKKFLYEGKEYDLSEMVAEFKYDYCQDLVGILNESWSEVLKEVNRVVFIGGGTEVIKDLLPNKANFVVPENPSFANVLGFYKYGQRFVKTTHKEEVKEVVNE